MKIQTGAFTFFRLLFKFTSMVKKNPCKHPPPHLASPRDISETRALIFELDVEYDELKMVTLTEITIKGR